jgi:beta-N-acetylhexosaminidase
LAVGVLAPLWLAACGSPLPSVDPGKQYTPSAGANQADETASPTPEATTSAEPTPTPTPSVLTLPTANCSAQADDLDLSEQLGQLLMVGVSGALDSSESQVIQRYHIGSVILLDQDDHDADEVAELTAQLNKLDESLLIAVDQEGGQVQRLDGEGFTRIPAAADQAAMGNTRLAARAKDWGEELSKAGVKLNLAPVADVVPAELADSNEPIGQTKRGYGSDPQVVSAKTEAFITGMHEAAIGTAIKHFPGLGSADGNTDGSQKVTDDTITSDSTALQPFKHNFRTADAVMVSSAYYTKIDPDNIAAFSPTVIGLIRQAGFDKVILSDDMGKAKAMSGTEAADRGVKFIRAGGDLAISISADVAADIYNGLDQQAEDDPNFAALVEQAATRVLNLKASVGLIQCS